MSLVSSKVQLLTYRHKPPLFPNAKKQQELSLVLAACVFGALCLPPCAFTWHAWCCTERPLWLFGFGLEFDVHVLKVLGAQSWFKLPCGPHTPFPGFPNPGRAKGKKWTAQISNAGVPQGWVLPPLRLNTNDFQTSAKSHVHVLMTQFQLFVDSLRARSAKSGVQIVIGYPEIR